MAISQVKYNYTFDLTYVGENNQTFDISPEKIISVFICEDYDNNNMPLIFLTLSLDKKQIALLAQTTETAKMVLSKYKFVTGNEMGTIKELCFRQDFTFFMNTNADYVNSFDYSENGENENQLFRQFNIGLLMIDHVNGTRTQLDGVLSGTNMVNLVYSVLGNRPVLIEPFLDNSVKSNIIMPPSTSISQLLKKLNNISTFYNTPYRFFQGIDCTYLISSSGNAVKKKNEKMTKVIININENTKADEQAEGFYIDDQQSCYILEIPTSAKEITKNLVLTRSYNTIDGIDTNGNKVNKDIITDTGVINTKKELIRLPNGNTRKVDNLKSTNLNNTWIRIEKNCIDNTVFTINKEYWFSFKDGSENKDGKYLLSKKDEIYYRFEEDFMCSTKLTFKNVE